jgi:hypothetical protein
MKQELLAAGKTVAVTTSAAAVVWLTEVKDFASAITIVIAMCVAFIQLVYLSVKTYRYLFHEERRSSETSNRRNP